MHGRREQGGRDAGRQGGPHPGVFVLDRVGAERPVHHADEEPAEHAQSIGEPGRLDPSAQHRDNGQERRPEDRRPCREHKRATGKPLRRGAKRGKEQERSSEIQREARHRPAHGRAQRQGRECAGGRSDEGQPDGSDYLGSAVDEVWLVERRRLGDLLVIKEDVEVVHPCCRIFDAHASPPTKTIRGSLAANLAGTLKAYS